MAVGPLQPAQRLADFVLAPFDFAHAGLVASWASSERDALWLAPQTRPPITAASVLDWRAVGREPVQLQGRAAGTPHAYGELNWLNQSRGQMWLGHLIVAPGSRGRGLGRQLTELLLQRAFTRYRATSVSLVVFPENQAARRCYLAAGMIESGYEEHYFAAYGESVRLVRLTIDRAAAAEMKLI